MSDGEWVPRAWLTARASPYYLPTVPTTTRPRTLHVCLTLITAFAVGCAQPQEPEPPLSGAAASNAAESVLPALAELPVLVLPVQRVGVASGLDWTPPGGVAAARRMADSLISDVLVLRGAGSKWLFADAARRSARRNPTYVANPDALAVSALARLRPGDPVPEPLASEIRGLVSLGDARHVLLPVELRGQPLEGDPPGTGRAMLLIAAIDARMSQLLWMGPVMGEPAPEFDAAAVESAVAKLADLIMTR